MRITEQELKKLKRTELCDLLLEQVKVIEDLQEKVDIQEEKLAERKVHIDKAGTIAEEDATDEIIMHNGKEYKKSELCNATLQWLEQILKKYYIKIIRWQ